MLTQGGSAALQMRLYILDDLVRTRVAAAAVELYVQLYSMVSVEPD